jgi:hypothetical protein
MPAYPFVPKSNRYLEAGQFWALPLSDGRYGCGRVMAVPAFGAKDRVGFVAGLAGWIGPEPPTEATIAGAPVLLQAKAHFETISKTGGSVLGIRPLELDGLVAIDPHDYRVGSVHRVWGWQTIVNKAELLAQDA